MNPPLGSRRPLCAHCGEFESGIDGLCIRCRRLVRHLIRRAVT